MQLKIPGFCQISSFAGPKWLKISFLSQIFNLTQNLYLVKFHPSQVQSGQEISILNQIFWPDWKLLNFAKFQPSQEWGGQKTQFLSQIFNTTQIFWILSNFIFADSEWSKSHFLTKFSTRLKYSGFCQISSFADSEWLKMSILRQIFTPTQNFWILLNSIHRMSWVDKVSVLAKFSQRLKISGFCLISSFAGP